MPVKLTPKTGADLCAEAGFCGRNFAHTGSRFYLTWTCELDPELDLGFWAGEVTDAFLDAANADPEEREKTNFRLRTEPHWDGGFNIWMVRK